MITKMLVPCTYQGGKQRIAPQIVDILLNAAPDNNTIFYDLCCGSGAISLELVNRGISPEHIRMLDISSWGVFWSSIGKGTFDNALFQSYINNLPNDKREYKAYCSSLSSLPITNNEAELFIFLQANSFGGKQICRKGNSWQNACFRDYWEPTETSIRRSPANPMQPSPKELLRRIDLIRDGMKGVVCLNKDIMSFFDEAINPNSIIYVDPPYKNTTAYVYGFNIIEFIKKFVSLYSVPIFVSEGYPLNDNSIKLSFGGANGGITGSRKIKHEEWISRY